MESRNMGKWYMSAALFAASTAMTVRVCKDCIHYAKPCKETGKFVARKKQACESYLKKK